MIFKLSPMRHDDSYSLSVQGESFYINDEEFNLSSMPDNTLLEEDSISSYWVKKIEKFDGIVSVTLILPHSSEAPNETLFPQDIINPVDGDVQLPEYEIEKIVEEPEEEEHVIIQ